ncbi:FAD-dependent oxidoreductase [Streptomyces cellulosae]|uniref:FAD-dependent oxidoreductase n=1 Tax=Streptomyces cellulosae TaxID=1968 RepID=UPI0004C611F7|nr:FAD-dependent oxidoreductase [Streptomyces cellulosae]
MTSTDSEPTLSTDVLVVGGGPAGTWAAIKAAQAGAEVVLADKGYTGASGATASVGTGIWYVDDVSDRPAPGTSESGRPHHRCGFSTSRPIRSATPRRSPT